MDIFAARAIVNWHSRSVSKSGYCAIRRDCLKKKTVAYAVNSLTEVNSSHRTCHNSTSESVITFGKTCLNKWGDDYTREKGRIWALCLVLLIWSGPVRSHPSFANGLSCPLSLPNKNFCIQQQYFVDVVSRECCSLLSENTNKEETKSEVTIMFILVAKMG